jgi:hypothetical protein
VLTVQVMVVVRVSLDVLVTDCIAGSLLGYAGTANCVSGTRMKQQL